MADYLIQDTTMQGIADAVRNMRHEKGTMTPAQIEAKIEESRLGVPCTISSHINPVTGEWERPSDWPDIDALAAQIVGDQDCVYLTYDLRKTPGYGWIGLYASVTDGSAWTVERGHVSNGVFISDYTVSVNSASYFRETLEDTYGDVQLWRITASGHIKGFGFVANTATNINNFQNAMQPCVQRSGKLPWISGISNSKTTSATSTGYITYFMEKDALIPGKNSIFTTLATAFAGGASLQIIDCSGWDTSNWEVTSITSMFDGCNSLYAIDMSGWDTSNWNVKGMSMTFDGCRSLRYLDLSGWDTSNWEVEGLHRCWTNCISLEKIDFTGWDTSKFKVNALSDTWDTCVSLKSLDLNHWDTSNWIVNNFVGCWLNCWSLQSLNISNWDTSNWDVANMTSCFNQCMSLKTLDLSKWDTSGWHLTSMSNCFAGCSSLSSIDLSNWDTSNWSITAISNMFGNLFGLPIIRGTSTWTFIANLSSNTNNPNYRQLEVFDGIPLSVNHSYSTAVKLTPASLVSILTALPTVSSTRTITLGQENRLKLTAEQIAIATNKGWTVA